MATAASLMCGICRGPYKKPKILSCFHSFCEVCLDSHISKAKPNPKFQCPLCRTAIDIPKGGACSLQNNFYIETTYGQKAVEKEETENVSILCENCEDDERPEAVKYCEVCQLRICENCVLLHKKLKATKSHELVDSIDNHKYKGRACYEHDKKIADRYCFSCEDFICSTCQDQGHKSHTIDDIDKAIRKRKEDVWRNVSESDTYFHVAEKRMKIIQDLETNIRKNEEQAMTDLGKRANEMKEEIDKDIQRLSAEIKDICEKDLDKLNTVKTAINSAQKNKEITKNWISSADDKEILMTSDIMMRKIMEINSSLPTYIPAISLVTFAQNTGKIFDAKSVGLVNSELKSLAKQGQIQMECVKTIFQSSGRKIKFMVSYKDRQVLMAEEMGYGMVYGLSVYFNNGSTIGHLLREFVISGVDVDNDGNLFASVPGQNKVYKIDSDQKASVFCTVDIPGSIAICPDGRVAVTSGNPPKLLMIQRNGAILSYVQPSNCSFNSLKYIAVCKYTNTLAAVDKGSNTVYLFNHKNQTVGQCNIIVNCITSNNSGQFLLGLTSGVGMIDLQGNLVATLVCSQFSFQATSLTLDTLNQLWVGENGQIFIFNHPDLSVLVN